MADTARGGTAEMIDSQSGDASWRRFRVKTLQFPDVVWLGHVQDGVNLLCLTQNVWLLVRVQLGSTVVPKKHKICAVRRKILLLFYRKDYVYYIS